MKTGKLVALVALALLIVSPAALAAGRDDHPQGPTDGTPAVEAPDHGASADDSAAPVRGPGDTGTARASQEAGMSVPVGSEQGRGPIHAAEVLQGLIDSGRLPQAAADVILAVIVSLQEVIDNLA